MFNIVKNICPVGSYTNVLINYAATWRRSRSCGEKLDHVGASFAQK